MNLGELRKRVEDEINTYKYEVPASAVGNAWPANKVEGYLQNMRSSPVEPYWADITLRDTHEQMFEGVESIRRCAIVADDAKGTVVAFDPADGEFLLATREAEALSSFGVRGDAVGCFMAI